MKNTIEEKLKEKGIKKGYLAKEIGKTNTCITNYCQNTSQPSCMVLYQIAKVLNCSMDDLIKED